MARQKMTRAAATLVMALGVTVIGGSIAGGIALASGRSGDGAPAVSDTTEETGAGVPNGNTTATEPGDDRHGDDTTCETGDDCVGTTAPAPTGDDSDDDSDDSGHNSGDDHDDDDDVVDDDQHDDD